jgi:hypothetical protein
MAGAAVTEISILVPSDQADTINALRERFTHHLETLFPRYRFLVYTRVQGVGEDEPAEIDRFMAIPVMGAVGDSVSAALPDFPDPDVMRDIVDACNMFDPAQAHGLAA